MMSIQCRLYLSIVDPFFVFQGLEAVGRLVLPGVLHHPDVPHLDGVVDGGGDKHPGLPGAEPDVRNLALVELPLPQHRYGHYQVLK